MKLGSLVVSLVVLFPVGRAVAQESPTPAASPTEEEVGCQIGQICSDIDLNSDRKSGPVHDPAGNYVRSLVTMGAIVIVVGSYFFFALGWGRFFSRFRKGTERP